MEDEAQKRNTDCVYFLASPLTCKKGNECEYRHSEAARVNPRDCWYWVSGCCLNANCSFRHPPLDVRPPSASPSTPAAVSTNITTSVTSSNGASSSASAAPAALASSKSKVPCFYHSQGFCARGIKCSFMHGPPIPYRKESMTYRKPPTNEQQSGQEGNGLSSIKTAKALVSTQEGFYGAKFPSSVASFGKPQVSLAGDRADQGRSNQTRNADEMPKQNHSVESRAPVPIHKQSVQSRINSEMQERLSEQGQHIARELHLGDLRNHLVKRRRNEGSYTTQTNSPQGREQSGERSGSGLVSRGESKEAVSVTSKRVKQENDSSAFTGPKSLAQIKAEKKNTGVVGTLKSDEQQDLDQIARAGLELQRKKVLDGSDDSQVITNGDSSDNFNAVQQPILKYDSHEVDPGVSGSERGRTSPGTIDVMATKRHNGLTDSDDPAEVGYVSHDDVMEDGTEAADADFAFDDDEDDFAKKLGCFL